jgi:hypothetical protein
MKGHSSRLEQAKQNLITWRWIEIKGKTEELLVKQLKICESNMQELTTSIKKQTWESWASKKKRCKKKEFVIHSTK